MVEHNGYFMKIDNLLDVRKHHYAWRLLADRQAPLILAFLFEEFVSCDKIQEDATKVKLDLHAFLENTPSGFLEVDNNSDLVELNTEQMDTLYYAGVLLDRWKDEKHGYLRRVFVDGSIMYEITTNAMKAIQWVRDLEERSFIGTESRFDILLSLIRETALQLSTDPQEQLQSLKRKRDEIDAQIKKVEEGILEELEPYQVREKMELAKEMTQHLTTDFRDIKDFYYQLQRKLNEEVVSGNKSKGDVLAQYFDEQESLRETNQGKSVQAFWHHLKVEGVREQWNADIQYLLSLPMVKAMGDISHLSRLKSNLLKEVGQVLLQINCIDKDIANYLNSREKEPEERRVSELVKSIERLAIEIEAARSEADISKVQLDPPMEIGIGKLGVQSLFHKTLHEEKERIHTMYDYEMFSEEELPKKAVWQRTCITRREITEQIQTLLESQKTVTLKELMEAYPVEEDLYYIIQCLTLSPTFHKEITEDQLVVIKSANTDRVFRCPQVTFSDID